ncbi:MAG: acetolactate synthase large subunit [Myxococcota bacterium]
MKASDLFLRCLEAEGVEYIFGVPGEENADVMMSLLDSPIQFIICRHEQGAAFMADLYGRMTGRPGVCLGTLGPGATNLTTGVASANMDNSPVLVVTGQGATTRLHKESHQIMNVVEMFRPITKWATSIYDERNIPEVVRKAFKTAAAEKPGAVHVELPEDIAKNDVEDCPIVPGLKVRRPVADGKSIEKALELIAAAQKPLILAGNGCIRTRVSKQLNRFIDRTGIFVATTFMGKGAVSDRHPRSLYAAGLGARDRVALAFGEADLVIAIGYDLVEWHPSRWNAGVEKRVLHLDFEPAEVDTKYRPDVEVVGDLAAGLWAINERVTAAHEKSPPAFEDVREALYFELEQEYAKDTGFPLKPQRILADLRREMRDEDILISDVGAHKMWVARHYPTYTPGSCIISNGFCSMGIALPGAIGAKLVRADCKVVGLCGDGGFLMNVQELATAAQYEIPCVILVWEDSEYGLIRWKQEDQFGKHSHIHFKNPDLVELSRAFGCHAREVTSPDELRPALREAFGTTDRPSVIVVPVDYAENMKLTQRLGELVCPS